MKMERNWVKGDLVLSLFDEHGKLIAFSGPLTDNQFLDQVELYAANGWELVR